MDKQTPGYSSLVETISEASSAAEAKCRLVPGQVIVLGFIAAAYLAFGTVLAIAAGATIESLSVQKIVMGAVFPVGLIAVVVAGSELSTGNYLTTPLGAMTLSVGWGAVFRNWTLSYAGNFIGSIVLAWVVIYGAHIGNLWGEPWIDLLSAVTVKKAHLAPWEAFWRAFLCIWLVDLAIWQSYRVKDYIAKFFFIWFPTFAFFTLGLEHSVVNMFLFPAAIFAGADISWQQFLLNNLLPVVLGNLVGGMFIVGLLYWFSAGLPYKSKDVPVDRDTGAPESAALISWPSALLRTISQGSGMAAAFLVLLPGGAALLGLLLPESWGIAIPIMVIAYFGALVFAFSFRLTQASSDDGG